MPPIGEYQDDDHRSLHEQNALHLHHHFHFHMALDEDDQEGSDRPIGGADSADEDDDDPACPFCDTNKAGRDDGIHITLHIDTGGQQQPQERPQVGMLPLSQYQQVSPPVSYPPSYHMPPPPPGPPGQPIFQLQNGENGGLSPLFARYSGVRAASANGEHGEDLLLLCFEPTPGTVQQHIPQPAILLNEAGAAHLMLLLQRWIQDGKGIASSQSDESGGGGEPA